MNTSTGSGQGGVGTADGSGHNNAAKTGDATVYDPSKATNGETLDVGGNPGQGSSTEVGKTTGPNSQGESRVQVSGALPSYEREATRAMDQANIPPSMRAVVRAYFERLAQR